MTLALFAVCVFFSPPCRAQTRERERERATYVRRRPVSSAHPKTVDLGAVRWDLELSPSRVSEKRRFQRIVEPDAGSRRRIARRVAPRRARSPPPPPATPAPHDRRRLTRNYVSRHISIWDTTVPTRSTRSHQVPFSKNTLDRTLEPRTLSLRPAPKTQLRIPNRELVG